MGFTHVGHTCAEYLSKNLVKIVMSELEKNHVATPRDATEFTLLDSDKRIKDSYVKADLLFQDRGIPGGAPANTKSGYRTGPIIDDAGSTAITVFIKRNNKTRETEIICANTGDSRCVLYLGRSMSKDVKTIVEPMSFDHKPTNMQEKTRIKESGGFVEFGRVNGTLAVSRAFGDLGYKRNTEISACKQAVTALPDIKRVKFTVTHSFIEANGQYDFLILACDGIWDVMTNDAACQFVLQKIREQRSGEYWKKKEQEQQLLNNNHGGNGSARDGAQKKRTLDMGDICEDLLDHCVRKLDSKDNVSATVVLFK